MIPLVTGATSSFVNKKRECFGKLTDDALPVVIGLTFGGLVTRKLPVNFVFDAAHCDERSDNTSPTTGLH